METPAKKQSVKPIIEYCFTFCKTKMIRYCHDALEFGRACNVKLDLAMPFIPIVIKNSSRLLIGHSLSFMPEDQFLRYRWCLCCHGVPLSYALQKEFILEMADVRYHFIKDTSKKGEELLSMHIKEFECKPWLHSTLKDTNKNLLEAGVIEWDEKSCWYKHGPNSHFGLTERKEEEKRALLLQRLIPYVPVNEKMLKLLVSYKRS